MDQGKLPLIPAAAEILIIRFKSLGDILLSSVVASEIARQRPDAVIDALVDAPFQGVMAGYPFIRREIIRAEGVWARLGLLRSLRRRYDLVIDLHGTVFASVTGALASRGLHVGFAGKRFARLTNQRIAPRESSRHTVEIYADVVEALGLVRPVAPSPVIHADATVVAAFRRRLGDHAALIHAGGRFAHKVWPAERFLETATRLGRLGYDVHLLAGPNDPTPPCLQSLPLVEGVSPADLGSLMKSIRLFVGNDSGPMHYAAAAGVPVVGIFGPSQAERWRPWSPIADASRCEAIAAPCRCGAGSRGPCRRPTEWCLETIDVAAVMEAVGRVTAEER